MVMDYGIYGIKKLLPKEEALTPIAKIDEVIELNGKKYKRVD